MAETEREPKLSRRTLLKLGGFGLAAAATGYLAIRHDRAANAASSLVVNDIHSKLNKTMVDAVVEPESFEDLVGTVESSYRNGKQLSICGSRHAMGGQQFASGTTLVDTRKMNSVIDLDTKSGIVHTEAGIEWPDLVDHLLKVQPEGQLQWTIPAKQTGADKLTLGGAISANAHGRGLSRTPISGDIESLLLIRANGEPVVCSRTSNRELFSLVLGGYGLFGVIHSAKLRLVPREKIERVVIEVEAKDLMSKLDERIKDGYVSGDWQFAIDETSDDFLAKGVCACYKQVPLDTKISPNQKKISDRSWNELVYLAHTEKSRAFKLYLDYYLSTNGQIYWSDVSQIGGYAYNYHEVLDKRSHSANPATEMITELYVPRDRFADFMHEAAASIRKNNASVIYGTVRLIKKDEDSFLAWARQDYACIIFNLHVEHTEEKIKQASRAFRDLIDLASDRGGSYFLTYHRWATKEQVNRCYPQFEAFLAKKRQYDPSGMFQSEWYRHYSLMFHGKSVEA